MKLTDSERMELKQQVNARKGRADIRAKLDCSDSFIDLWNKHFASNRMAGLFSRYAGREH
ncbi:hypothetical protein ACFQAT_27180 [Undibacterium arcticum]|uniref:Uncharacterized protein n=1 Tax=Undibacterium arcticum TaxID=1762892 RepID=A0ABV7F9S1_9BURK